MSKRILLSALGFAVMFFVYTQALAQTALSQNSGINSADSWITATLQVNENGSVTLSAPFTNPQTQLTSNVLPLWEPAI
jgi:hypothetical protein